MAVKSKYRENRPPVYISVKFCPECGRDDRFTPFTGTRHFSMGEVCPGKVVTQRYKRIGQPQKTA